MNDKVKLRSRIRSLLQSGRYDEIISIGEPAVPDLITALKDKYLDVRERAAGAIGKIGVNDKQFEMIVRKLKEGETKEEREGAAMALGELKNVKAVPDLIAALKDKNSDVQWRAAEALEKIGFEKVPEEKRMEVKVLALLILEKTNDAAAIGEPAVPYLITALKDENRYVRYEAAEALEKIIGKLIEKGEFEEALETIRSTTTTIMNFYKGAFRTARKENKTMGKDRDLLAKRRKLLEKLESLTNEVHARVKEKEGLPNPLNEKEPMEWKRVERTEKGDTVRRGSLRHS